MSNYLVDKTVVDLKIRSDKEALCFFVETMIDPGAKVTEKTVVYVEADCCSYTWIESIELPALGLPFTVLAVEDLDLPGSDDDHPEFDYLQVYGCKITTNKGDMIIDFRNSSNGYYGGNLCWPGYYNYCPPDSSDVENWLDVEDAG